MALGCDFSFSRPSPLGLKAAGISAVGRYLWETTGGKGLSKAEYDSYARVGIRTWYIFEEDGTELTGGWAAGVRVAQRAERIRKAQGLPPGAIYFTIDHDYAGPALAACVQAIKGAVSVLGFGRVGIYGGYSHILAMQAARACAYYWQTFAWSYGKVASGIHLYQYDNGVTLANGNVDLCQIKQANFGQPGAAVAGGGGTPIGEADMGTLYSLPISFVPNNTDATIWLYGPTGKYTGIKSAAHLTLIRRVAKNDANDKMLRAELDIVASYLAAVNALGNITLSPAQISQIISALSGALTGTLNVTLTGKAVPA